MVFGPQCAPDGPSRYGGCGSWCWGGEKVWRDKAGQRVATSQEFCRVLTPLFCVTCQDASSSGTENKVPTPPTSATARITLLQTACSACPPKTLRNLATCLVTCRSKCVVLGFNLLSLLPSTLSFLSAGVLPLSLTLQADVALFLMCSGPVVVDYYLGHYFPPFSVFRGQARSLKLPKLRHGPRLNSGLGPMHSRSIFPPVQHRGISPSISSRQMLGENQRGAKGKPLRAVRILSAD